MAILQKLLLSAFAIVLAIPAYATTGNEGSAKAINSVDDYPFPEVSSDLATICSPAMYIPKAQSEEIHVRVLKELPKTATLRHRKKLELRYYPATQASDELVMIIGGIGAEANSIFSKFFGQRAQANGQHAIAFPNTLTENFIYSSSTTGLVGETQPDAVDLHRAMTASMKKLEREYGLKNPRIRIVGYSHGALLAAAVDSVNLEQGKPLNIAGVLLVNPPVDLLFGLRNVDNRAAAAKKIPLPRLVKLGLRFREMVNQAADTPLTIESYMNYARNLRYSQKEQYAIIGFVMQNRLGPAIFASQRIDDLEIIPSITEEPNSNYYRYQVQDARAAADNYSYEEYFRVFFGKRAARDRTLANIHSTNRKASLYAYESHLRSSSHIYVSHNQDDLLLRPEDTRWLADVFGTRARLYPRGGHLGNIWFPKNVEFFDEWMRK